MKRREALKSITLSTGVVISAGSFFGLLQSCQEKDKISWIPQSFTTNEAITVSELSNLIFPKDDLPGALDVNVPQFIDLLMKNVFKPEDGERFKDGLKVFSSEFSKEYGSEFHEGSQEEQQAFAEKMYNLSKPETEKVLKWVKEENTPPEKEDQKLMYHFLVTQRELTIQSYFTSEKVGEEILSYDPIPGRQQGCVPVEEIGNVWSL